MYSSNSNRNTNSNQNMNSNMHRNSNVWIFITGGCSGRGVQWIGVALYSKTDYTIM